jgi:hypothetical protein
LRAEVIDRRQAAVRRHAAHGTGEACARAPVSSTDEPAAGFDRFSGSTQLVARQRYRPTGPKSGGGRRCFVAPS